PLLEFLVLGLQTIDLGKGAGIGACALQSVAAENSRHRCSLKHRRRQVDKVVTDINQEAMADAAQNQEDGTEEIEREGKQLDRPAPSAPPRALKVSCARHTV